MRFRWEQTDKDVLSRLADHLLLMPGARENVQGDRACADLKLPPSPVYKIVGLSHSRSTQDSNHSHPLSVCLQSRRERKVGFDRDDDVFFLRDRETKVSPFRELCCQVVK